MNSCDCKTREPGDESPPNLSAAPVDRPSRINWDVEQSISAHFEAVTQHHPKHRAIGSGQWQPTYEELNGVANSLAHSLVSRGLKSGDRVAILMRQDGTSIAAIIGVLKAGGIVVVMNSSDPQVRLDQIFADAEPRLVITDSANHELAVRVAKNDAAVVSFDPRSSAPELNLNLTIAPDALAFLIYTSGTSGKPKGVMQSQRTVLHNALRLSRGLEVTDEDRIILLASPSGGQGVSTIWCALSNGAAIYPFAASEQGIGSLKDWMNTNKITIYVSAVSIYRHFMKSLGDVDVLPHVRLVRLGAEKAIASDFAAFRKHFSDQCILLNSLSSSETGNVAQHRFDYGNTPSGGALPVGMPATGMEILLLDDHGREVAPDQIGEIIVRSRYLSPGYWRNEALTAERFSCDPASDGAWRFRTGDFGRKDATGALIFTDRKDNRVKINGYRIELAEVENALNTLSGVHQAVVCARTDNGGNTKLVGYVVPRAGEERSSTDLRQKLFSLLPNYMAPSQFIFLDELPLTPQGKLDYQRLPPAHDANNASRTILPPRDVVERNLVKVFETVLAISPVSRSDDFFDLGGTSLQSVQAMAAIEEVFNIALPPSILADRSTVEKLAPLLAEHAVVPSPRPLVTLRADGDGRPLFFIHSGQGDVVTYALLTRRLEARPVYGLQAVGIQGESWPLMSIPTMADRYLPEILEKDPTGPYLLAGTCMGGMVAFELAQRLTAMGRKVGLLVLIDSPTAPYSGNRPVWHEIVMDQLRDTLRILRWGVLRGCGCKINIRRLPAYRHFVAEMTGRATRRYHPSFYPGTVTLMLTADTKYRIEDRRPLISRYARETRTFMISGTRTRLFMRPQVDELAQHLQQCLDESDRAGD